jgi:hypothetical protein
VRSVLLPRFRRPVQRAPGDGHQGREQRDACKQHHEHRDRHGRAEHLELAELGQTECGERDDDRQRG